MSLKIKNPKRFLISLIVTLLLLLFVIVGFFTVMGKIIGLFTKKDEPQATPEPTATAQAATPRLQWITFCWRLKSLKQK